MKKKEEIDALLNLSIYEKRIYFVLNSIENRRLQKLATSTVKRYCPQVFIVEESGYSNAVVYSCLMSLEKKGLVEYCISITNPGDCLWRTKREGNS